MARADRMFRESPYQGLTPYDEQDADFFFGRERERELIIANLMASRLTLLYGESGVGKSSVLRAGVLYRLRQLVERDVAGGTAPEFAVVMINMWREDPAGVLIHSVQTAVQAALQAEVPSPRDDLSLADQMKFWAERLGGDLFIILDQFEEYFMYNTENDGFADGFVGLANTRDLRINVLLSIREDAVAKLDRFKGRIPNLFDNYLRIEHLDPHAARSAIQGPVERYNQQPEMEGKPVELEPTLVEAVLEQVRTGQVAIGNAGRGVLRSKAAEEHDRIETPYLQLVMTRLWDAEKGGGEHGLRLSTLHRLGGAEQIVRTHLDEAMSFLSTPDQEVAASVFRYLVTPSGTKIAHTVEDLAELADTPLPHVGHVIEALASGTARILRAVAPPPGREKITRYEIFHDVLAAAILDWRGRHVVAQQQKARDREQQETERKIREKLTHSEELARAQRRAATLSRRFAVVGFVFFLITASVAAVAVQQRNEAERQRRNALSLALAANAVSNLTTDPELSLLLATRAAGFARTPEVKQALSDSLMASHIRAAIRNNGELNSARFSPDGKFVVTAGEDSGAQIWEWASAKEPVELPGSPTPLKDASFSSDAEGRYVILVGDFEAQVWDRTPVPRVLARRMHDEPVDGAAFSPDGLSVLTWGDDGVRVWDREDGTEPLIRLDPHEPASHAAFSSSGTLVVAAFRDAARVWGWTSGNPQPFELPSDSVLNWAELSGNENFVVTSAQDGTTTVWDWKRERNEERLDGSPSATSAIGAAFSPGDVGLVMTTLANGTVRLWEWRTGAGTRYLRHPGEVNSAVFSPDGSTVLTAAADGIARVWDAMTAEVLVALRSGRPEVINDAAFSPDGSLVVTATEQAARVWEWRAQEEPIPLMLHDLTVEKAVFGAGAALLVTVGDGEAHVWEVETGKEVVGLARAGSFLERAAFSRDGQLIVTTESDDDANAARVWNLDGEELAQLEVPQDHVQSAVFAPDGSHVLTLIDGPAMSDTEARVWNWRTGDKTNLNAGQVIDAAFSRSGKWIVTASMDGSARVWDWHVPEVIAETPPASSAIGKAVFGPGDRYLLVARQDGSAEVWEWSETEGLRVRATLGGGTGLPGRAGFSPDPAGRFAFTMSEGTTHLWNWRSGSDPIVFPGASLQAFSPDGAFVLTLSEENRPIFRESDTGAIAAAFDVLPSRASGTTVTPAGQYVVAAGSILQKYTCEVCRSFDDLLSLARTRVTRTLNPEELEPYL